MKLYIITNNKVADKGKLARACATIGAYSPKVTLLCPCIVVKGGDKFEELIKEYDSENRISGIHIDAGHTQVENGTVLAFGVITETKSKLDELKLL